MLVVEIALMCMYFFFCHHISNAYSLNLQNNAYCIPSMYLLALGVDEYIVQIGQEYPMFIECHAINKVSWI